MSHRVYVGTIGEGLFAQHRRRRKRSRAPATACSSSATSAPWPSTRDDPRSSTWAANWACSAATDGADNWARRRLAAQRPADLVASAVPHAPELIVVGTCPSRLFRSDDGGRTWREARRRPRAECPRIMHTRVTTLIADPDEPDTLWAGRRDRRPLPQPRRRPDLAGDRHGSQLAGHSRPGRRPGQRPAATPAGGHQQRPEPQRRRRRDLAAAATSARACPGPTAAAWPSRAAGRRCSSWATATARRERLASVARSADGGVTWQAGDDAGPGQQHLLEFRRPPGRPGRWSTPAASAARSIARQTAARAGRSCRASSAKFGPWRGHPKVCRAPLD